MERLSCVHGRALKTIWKSITEGLIMSESNHSRSRQTLVFSEASASKNRSKFATTRANSPPARGSVIRQITEKSEE